MRLAGATIHSAVTYTIFRLGAVKKATGASIALAVLLGSCFPSAHAGTNSGPAWSIIDLGTLASDYSRANAINNRGQVVGQSGQPGTDAGVRAFLYEDGVMTDLKFPGSFAVARGINDAGEIIGYSDAGGHYHPVLYRDGVVNELSISAYAYAINNAGIFVGVLGQAEAGVALMYKKGTASTLGTLGGPHSYAFAINNAGTIVGTSIDAGGAGSRAFAYRDGHMIDLGTLGGTFSVARGINDRGVIVGTSTLTEGGMQHAFVYDGSGMRSIAAFGANSSAHGVNNAGEIVGTMTPINGDDHAFLYRCGVMTDLNTIPEVQQAGWRLVEAAAINDRGQIVGTALINRRYHAYLLSPSSTRGPCVGTD